MITHFKIFERRVLQSGTKFWKWMTLATRHFVRGNIDLVCDGDRPDLEARCTKRVVRLYEQVRT